MAALYPRDLIAFCRPFDILCFLSESFMDISHT